MRPRHRTLAALLAAATLAGGCASSARTSYTHPSADLGAIRKVAVLPFTSLTVDPAAAAKVHRIFLVELLATGVVEVVEPGAVTQIQLAERIESADTLTPADLQRIGQALAADGLFLGTVVDFEENRIGTVPAPEVTIQLRLVETASGATVWSSSETRSGAGVRARLLGFGGDSLTAAARKLVREQLDTLVR
jgi:TolB-like protein